MYAKNHNLITTYGYIFNAHFVSWGSWCWPVPALGFNSESFGRRRSGGSGFWSCSSEMCLKIWGKRQNNDIYQIAVETWLLYFFSSYIFSARHVHSKSLHLFSQSPHSSFPSSGLSCSGQNRLVALFVNPGLLFHNYLLVSYNLSQFSNLSHFTVFFYFGYGIHSCFDSC